MTAWADKYIGEAWNAETHTCWHFFKRVQCEVFQIEVLDEQQFNPDSALSCARALSTDHSNHWSEQLYPKEGDAVLMGHNAYPVHIGIWTGDAVLHCQRDSGVILQNIFSLHRHGWGYLKFYRHLSKL